MSSNQYDVVVIGAGITGLTATKQLLEQGLRVANIEAETFGGLVININELEGAVEGSGAEYASTLMMEASDAGAEMLSDAVSALAPSRNGWTVTTGSDEISARAVIVASGAHLKRLDIPGEVEFEYKGVSHCADCDGPLFSDQAVVVAGGGDSALQEAHTLAQFCSTVHLINRADDFTASAHWIDAIKACANVQVRHGWEPTAILGADGVEKVQIAKVADQTREEIDCMGFFGFIGLVPASEFAPADIPRDASGALVTDASLQAAPGLFVAGAVRAGFGGKLSHAIAEGKQAAQQAARAIDAA